MNEQRILFIVGKSRLKYLDEEGKTRELTFAELREINEIKEILFEIVVRYKNNTEEVVQIIDSISTSMLLLQPVVSTMGVR